MQTATTCKFIKDSNDGTILVSVMSTGSVLEAVTTDALQYSIGMSRVHVSLSAVSYGEWSDSKSSTDVSALWRPSVHVSCDGFCSLLYSDVCRRSRLTSSSGKLYRQLRMSSEKWKPSVSACLAMAHYNNNLSLSLIWHLFCNNTWSYNGGRASPVGHQGHMIHCIRQQQQLCRLFIQKAEVTT